MGKDILYRVVNGGRCGCETVSREVVLQVEIPEKYPDSKVRVANMGPTWILAAPGGPHVGPMNLAIRVDTGAPMFCHNNWCAIKIAHQFLI